MGMSPTIMDSDSMLVLHRLLELGEEDQHQWKSLKKCPADRTSTALWARSVDLPLSVSAGLPEGSCRGCHR